MSKLLVLDRYAWYDITVDRQIADIKNGRTGTLKIQVGMILIKHLLINVIST